MNLLTSWNKPLYKKAVNVLPLLGAFITGASKSPLYGDVYNVSSTIATTSLYISTCVHVRVYRIAGYIGGNNVWRIARKMKKIARYKFGGYGTMPSPGVYAVGAILAV